jgi:hypothetical protein
VSVSFEEIGGLIVAFESPGNFFSPHFSRQIPVDPPTPHHHQRYKNVNHLPTEQAKNLCRHFASTNITVSSGHKALNYITNVKIEMLRNSRGVTVTAA